MEQVFVVDRAAFFGGDWPQGFLPLDPAAAAPFLGRAAAHGRFVPRDDAERNPAWKQWIPYCVLRCVDAGQRPLGIFRVRRTTGQSEARLHGKWSIGLGGHIGPEDADPGPEACFLRALWRELDEELHLNLPERHELRLLGILNDDATPVGAVHAGLVYRIDLEVPLGRAQELVTIREISKMSGGFGHLADFENLWQDPGRFETWSQFLIHAGVAGPIGASGIPRRPARGLGQGG